MRRAALLAAVLTGMLPAGTAAAQAPPNKSSERVSYLGSLAEPGVISARFKGSLMYVSSESGLSIYDVKDAANPKQIGELALPNFENEDIDVGGGIALISNDPSEGLGRLHVIDVKDPTAPKLLTSFDTGTIYDSTFDGVLGPSIGKGTGHTASCLQDCKYVWLAGTAAGIDIIDLRIPSAPVYVKRFPATEAAGGLATHDVQFDRAGRAWVAGAGGTAAYDVTDPVNPKLVMRTDAQGQSRYGETFGADDGSTYNDFIHHNSVRLPNSALGSLPAGADPAADSDVVAITEEDYNRPTCAGAGSFETWRIDGALLHPLDKWDVEVDPNRQTLCSAHYFDQRGGLVAQGWYEQGTRFLDVSDPRDIRQVGFYIPQKNLTWGALFVPTDPSGEIVYALDNQRGIDVLRFDRPERAGAPLATLPAVVAPPSDPPSSAPAPGGGSPSSPTASSSATPNVSVSVSNALRSVRPRQRLRYRVTVRHLGGPAARDVVVRVVVQPRRRLTFRIPSLAAGAKRVFTVKARVRRRAKTVLVTAALTAAEDGNPRDNRAVDRDRVTRARARPASSLAGFEPSGASASERRAAARDHAMAASLRRARSVRDPHVVVTVSRAARSAYGWVCRIV